MNTNITLKQIRYIEFLHRLLERYGYASFEFKTYSEYSKLSSKQTGGYIRKLKNEISPTVYEDLQLEANLEEICGLGQE